MSSTSIEEPPGAADTKRETRAVAQQAMSELGAWLLAHDAVREWVTAREYAKGQQVRIESYLAFGERVLIVYTDLTDGLCCWDAFVPVGKLAVRERLQALSELVAGLGGRTVSAVSVPPPAAAVMTVPEPPPAVTVSPVTVARVSSEPVPSPVMTAAKPRTLF
jgi:hypothetical protein